MSILDWWDKFTKRETDNVDEVRNFIYHWLVGSPGQDGDGSNKWWNQSAIDKTKQDVAPYVPGAQQTQAIIDSIRYWNDYERNTGKTRKYPGLQTHSPDVGDVYSGFNWWVDW